MTQWLRLPAPNAGSLGLIPGQGTRSHMPQLKVCLLQRRSKIPHVTTKTWCSQISKEANVKKKKCDTEEGSGWREGSQHHLLSKIVHRPEGHSPNRGK